VQKGDQGGGKHGTKAKTKATFYAFSRIDDYALHFVNALSNFVMPNHKRMRGERGGLS
jgi:hypothetical protein